METDVRARETTAGYKGMFPKRAGKPELGEVGFVPAEDGAGPWSKNEASLHAYSLTLSPGSNAWSCGSVHGVEAVIEHKSGPTRSAA